MDKLTPNLTEEQLKQNIDALRTQKVPDQKIQEYVNNYQKTDSGFSLKGTMPKAVEPTDSERNYMKEGLKLYDKYWANPVMDLVKAPSKLIGEVMDTITSPAKNLALGTYAKFGKYGAKADEKYDDEWLKISNNVVERIRDPQTSIENKQKLAHTLNMVRPPNQQLEDVLGQDLTARKALYDTAGAVFETALLALSGGTGMSAKGFLPIIKGAIKEGLKFGGLQFGKTVADGMGENKPLEEIIGEGLKEGGKVGAFVGAVEAGIPFTRAFGGLISRGFGYVTDKVSSMAGRTGGKVSEEIVRLNDEVKTLTTKIEETAPTNVGIGEDILDTLALEQKVAKEKAVSDLKMVSNEIEKDFYNPAISVKEVGEKSKTLIDDWRVAEKEITKKFYNDEFLATNTGEPSAYLNALLKQKEESKNIAGFPLKSLIDDAVGKAAEIDPNAQRIIADFREAGFSDDMINAELKKKGLSAEPKPKELTLKELLDQKQTLNDKFARGSITEGYGPKDAILGKIVSALDDDIKTALEKLDPAKAKAYEDEISRFKTFKDKSSDVTGILQSKDPFDSMFNMSADEVSTMYKLPTVADSVGEIQQGIVNYAIEQSRELGSLNPSKLESFLKKAEKNNLLPAEDISKLKEFADLETLIQGNKFDATPAQKERLEKLLGEERFAQFNENRAALSDIDSAIQQVGGGKSVDQIRKEADLVVNDILKMKSAVAFNSVWKKLSPVQQKSVSQRAIANAFDDAFSYEGGVNFQKIKTYLEGVGIGGGNKKQIAKTLFQEPELKALEELFAVMDSIKDFKKASNNKVVQMLHLMLATGYVKTGQAPTAIYHFGSAFRLQKKAAPELEAKKLVDDLLGLNTPEEEIIMQELMKKDFADSEESILNEMGKIFEKLLIVNQSTNE